MLKKQDEFEFIQEYSKDFSLSVLFKLTSVSRSGFYKWKKSHSRPQVHQDEELCRLILDVFNESNGTYGVKRIKQALLHQYGWIVNHKCIRRIMHKYHLVCVLPKPKFKRRLQPNGTISNVLNREFYATKPLQKLCMDITYIKVNAPSPRWAYLCAVKDLYNQEIVAYDMSESQNMRQIYRVLDQLEQLPLEQNALLHTDQGYQFTNQNYIKKVADIGLIQSMSRRGNCWDNACIENFFRHLKAEMPFFSSPQTLEEIKQSISNYIHYYNTKRIQNKYGMSPVEYRHHAA